MKDLTKYRMYIPLYVKIIHAKSKFNNNFLHCYLLLTV